MKIEISNLPVQQQTSPRIGKVESADTAAEVVAKPTQTVVEMTQKSTAKPVDTESYTEFAHKPKLELSMDEREWIALIEKANKAIMGANKSFEYSIHEKTKQIMIKVIDSDTKEVIREIPPEKVLDLVARMWEMAGVLVDERR